MEVTAVCKLTFKWQSSADNKHMVADFSHAGDCSSGGAEQLHVLEHSTASICSWEGQLVTKDGGFFVAFFLKS